MHEWELPRWGFGGIDVCACMCVYMYLGIYITYIDVCMYLCVYTRSPISHLICQKPKRSTTWSPVS